MADNNFRSYPNRAAGIPSRAQQDDPLAELARLIGQTDPEPDPGLEPRRGPMPSLDDPAANPDWAAEDRSGARYPEDDRYAAPPAAAGDDEAAYDDRHEQPPHGEPFDSYRPGSGYDDDQRAALGKPASALSTRLNGGRDFAREYYVPPEAGRFRGTSDADGAPDPRVPAVQPRSRRDERFEFDDLSDQTPDEQAYALDEYQEEEAPARRGRRGIFVVAVVLGLAVIGTAGAFAYRAMFGSSMLPTLPPIIKADGGPNKIVPAKPKTNSDQADASDTGSGEKLVSREEQPVDMPAPVKATPRVVSTIPIFPDPNSAQAGVPNAGQPGMLGNGQGTPALASAPPPPTVVSSPPAQANSIWPPAPATAPLPAAASPASAVAPASPAAAATAPRKVHTVVIHSDQLGPMTADASSAPSPAPQPAPAAAPVRTAPPRAAIAPAARAVPVARVDANTPLSIIPGQEGQAPAPAPRLRTALARPAEPSAAPRAEPAGMASGSYAVQVTSQRSEAGAQAEFQALKAKFPSQLGGHQPLIRRADLGAKGVYYRALVGPFASADQATAMCASLKSAGGSCIVQRN